MADDRLVHSLDVSGCVDFLQQSFAAKMFNKCGNARSVFLEAFSNRFLRIVGSPFRNAPTAEPTDKFLFRDVEQYGVLQIEPYIVQHRLKGNCLWQRSWIAVHYKSRWMVGPPEQLSDDLVHQIVRGESA
jgi:hypothetical protein